MDEKRISIYNVSLAIMFVEGDDDIIQIETKIFLEKYQKLDNTSRIEFLLEKKKELQDNYKCFQVNFETYYHHNNDKKHYINHRERESYKTTKNNNRLHIISADFTETSKTKKLFVGYLNKLTNQNKEVLYPKIQDLIDGIKESELKSSLYKIIWEFIYRSNDNIYIDILKLYDNDMLYNRWEEYINKKEWIPSNEILENDILAANEDLYDIYCSYVKWKKGVTNVNKTWCKLLYNHNSLEKLDVLLEDLYEMFDKYYNDQKKEQKHIIDFTLEQMHIILQARENSKIIENIKTIDMNRLELSSKFLVLNILEKK